ncbi:hypothetical protein BDW74DRAFT_180975 [Aspergillus multicolor]|uniref:uncharacterized protein n=1 Tax=Aspergillus multicolor TaxID=41759 RepID=UPI003CCE2BC1
MARGPIGQEHVLNDSLIWNEDLALELLDRGVQDRYIDTYASIMVAAMHNRARALAALIKKGAQLNRYLGCEYTALTLATEHNRPEAVRCPLSAGADTSIAMELHVASRRGTTEYRESLSYLGPRALDFSDTIFGYAVVHGHADIVKLLVPYFDIAQPQKQGMKPLNRTS